uniref:FAD-dependent monooxygenase DEP2 ) n=1 Tax=Ganoderma boninense TaxID=34458 RepID=A0A5K1K6W4_9APHY|nr:FAD-dependent monooxygenase DEP2 (EC (Depudecin biosynthesis cluster protein 2) [Ganoderma boninense]
MAFDVPQDAELRYVEVNSLALNVTQFYAADLPDVVLEMGLSSVLFGILTALVLVALYFLFRNGLRQTSVRVLLPSTLLLYASTTLWIVAKGSYIGSVGKLVSAAQNGMYSDAFTSANVDVLSSQVSMNSTIMTMTLGLNVILGDSIVWWRACAVWRSRFVCYLGVALVSLTLGFGIAAIVLGDHDCPCHACPCLFPNYLFRPGAIAEISAVLSLGTNVLATVLIAVKAWQHRSMLRGRSGSKRKARVAKAFCLLLESGTMYSVLLILLVLYELGPARPNVPFQPSQNAMLRAEAYYTFGCFVPVVAIYPMLIIVLVALNRSPIENGLTTVQNESATAAAEASEGATLTNLALAYSLRSTGSFVVTDNISMQAVDMKPDPKAQSTAETSRIRTVDLFYLYHSGTRVHISRSVVHEKAVPVHWHIYCSTWLPGRPQRPKLYGPDGSDVGERAGTGQALLTSCRFERNLEMRIAARLEWESDQTESDGGKTRTVG